MPWETFTFLKYLRSCLRAELHPPRAEGSCKPNKEVGVYGLVGELRYTLEKEQGSLLNATMKI